MSERGTPSAPSGSRAGHRPRGFLGGTPDSALSTPNGGGGTTPRRFSKRTIFKAAITPSEIPLSPLRAKQNDVLRQMTRSAPGFRTGEKKAPAFRLSGVQDLKTLATVQKRSATKLPQKLEDVDSVLRAGSQFTLNPVSTPTGELVFNAAGGFSASAGKTLSPMPSTGAAEYSVLVAQLEHHRDSLSFLKRLTKKREGELEDMKTEIESMQLYSTADDPRFEKDHENSQKMEVLLHDLENMIVKAEVMEQKSQMYDRLWDRMQRSYLQTQNRIGLVEVELASASDSVKALTLTLGKMQLTTAEQVAAQERFQAGQEDRKAVQEVEMQWASGMATTLRSGAARAALQFENKDKIMSEINNDAAHRRRKAENKRQAKNVLTGMDLLMKNKSSTKQTEALARIRTVTGIKSPEELYQRMCGDTQSQISTHSEMNERVKERSARLTDVTEALKALQKERNDIQYMGVGVGQSRRDLDLVENRLKVEDEKVRRSTISLITLRDTLFPIQLGVGSLGDRLEHVATPQQVISSSGEPIKLETDKNYSYDETGDSVLHNLYVVDKKLQWILEGLDIELTPEGSLPALAGPGQTPSYQRSGSTRPATTPASMKRDGNGNLKPNKEPVYENTKYNARVASEPMDEDGEVIIPDEEEEDVADVCYGVKPEKGEEEPEEPKQHILPTTRRPDNLRREYFAVRAEEELKAQKTGNFKGLPGITAGHN